MSCRKTHPLVTDVKLTHANVPESILAIWTIGSVILCRSHNVPLVLLQHFSFRILQQARRTKTERIPGSTAPRQSLEERASIALICIMSYVQSAFFMFGNSNSLATIDLGNAYVGLEEYDALSVSMLTFTANWMGPLWWTVAGTILLRDAMHEQLDYLPRQCMTFEYNSPTKSATVAVAGGYISPSSIATCWTSTTVALLMINAVFFTATSAFLCFFLTILRDHLFIWTVFSPKYLYQMAWIFLYQPVAILISLTLTRLSI